MLEGSTTNETTLRASLVLIWFDDSPHSNQRIDKAIGPATDHRDQLMKISSFFNTHTRISLWNELSQIKLLSSNSPSYCLAYSTSSGVTRTDPWRKGGLWKNQLDHELNIAVRWQPGNTSEKIFRESRATGMLLSSRTILLFGARRYDRKSKELT